MNDATTIFFAKYCLREVSVKDFSDWAIYCLEQGIDSKNIRILASMFNVQYLSEVETYFIRSLDDLNLDFPTESKYFPKYSKLIARKIINKEINSIEGSNEIYKIFNLTYDPKLATWNYLINERHPLTYEDLSGIEQLHLLEEAIFEEAAKMIYGKKNNCSSS